MRRSLQIGGVLSFWCADGLVRRWRDRVETCFSLVWDVGVKVEVEVEAEPR